jgi:hypothetical protein
MLKITFLKKTSATKKFVKNFLRGEAEQAAAYLIILRTKFRETRFLFGLVSCFAKTNHAKLESLVMRNTVYIAAEQIHSGIFYIYIYFADDKSAYPETSGGGRGLYLPGKDYYDESLYTQRKGIPPLRYMKNAASRTSRCI